jgi:dethiobiotin synthetase
VRGRKPVQSFAMDEVAGLDPKTTDAHLLAAATDDSPFAVCPPQRWYERPMAPPMASDVLGRAAFGLADLLRELDWCGAVDLGLVETVGGVRSPMTHDADSVAYVRALTPDAVVLVADAGLGTINAVRLASGALSGLPFTVLLNRYDDTDDLHRRNRAWLAEHDGLAVVVDVHDARLLGASQ